MARTKRTVMQRDFTHMEIREDFLEGDDIDLRSQSLKGARNLRSLATRAAEARHGSFFVRTLTDAENVVEIKPGTGLVYGLILSDTSMEIIDEDGNLIYSTSSVPWTDASALYVTPFRERTIIGSNEAGIHILTYDEDDGSWDFSEFAFLSTVGGELAQPYWAFEQSATIQPDGTSGTVVVTASEKIWKNGHVGLRIRYGQREIEITEKISRKKVRGTVVNNLPPSFEITVADTTVFRVGEAVVGADTNFQGLVISIGGGKLNVVTTYFFEGPDTGEELSGPAGTSEVSAVTSISPLASPLWDEPLMSDLRGWPQSCSSVAGRIVFLDYPAVPDLITLSSSRDITDFLTGAEDDDAIVRQVGDGAPRWLHAVNMGDLLLFSDAGVYQVPARENGVISPSTFNPVLVDEMGAAEVPPVRIDDGVVFVEEGGQALAAVLLDGNVYLKWSVRNLTTIHDHLIKSPTQLCGPALGSGTEKFMFVVNNDGTLAAVSWRDSIRDEQVGFAPWDTQGSYVSVSPIFGGYWQVVDRSVNGSTVRFLERIDSAAYLDCAVSSSDEAASQVLAVNGDTLSVNGNDLIVVQAAASHLVGETVCVYSQGWDLGDYVVDSGGSVDVEGLTGEFQIGFNYESEMGLWPVEIIESPRVGTLTARVLELIVSVQNTIQIEVTCNGKAKTYGGYVFGDDLSAPPPQLTKVFRIPVMGRRDHPELIVAKRRPGPFRVLATGQRVQA